MKLVVNVTYEGYDQTTALTVSDDAVVKLGTSDAGGYNAIGEFRLADLLGRTGNCFRCGEEVSSQVEIAYVDGAGRNDCPQSEDGAPHEIDLPD